MSRVDDYERERAKAKGASVWTRLGGLGLKMPRLAMTQLAVIIVLAAGLAVTFQRADRLEALSLQERLRADLNQAALAREREKFQSLAESCPELSKDVARIKVAFRDTASQKQIRELLVDIGGSISAGPSAQNFCTVLVTAGQDRQRSEVVDAALARLRGNRIVISAEVLP